MGVGNDGKASSRAAEYTAIEIAVLSTRLRNALVVVVVVDRGMLR